MTEQTVIDVFLVSLLLTLARFHSVSTVDLEQVNACRVGYRPMAKYLWKVSNDE